MTFFESSSRSILFSEHDLFGKPAPTFPDHALAPCLYGEIVTQVIKTESRERSCRSQLKTNAQHSGRCMSPVVSRFPTRGTSAARWRCSIWDSRRLRPPVRALHGRLHSRPIG